MKRRLLILFISLIFVTGCAKKVQPSDVLELNNDDVKEPALQGHSEILTENNKVINEHLEFEMKVSFTHKDGLSRIFLFVDGIPRQFSVNGESRNRYYEVPSDGVERKLTFDLDLPQDSTIISPIVLSVPTSDNVDTLDISKMFYFLGELIPVVLNEKMIIKESSFVLLEAKPMEEIDLELKQKIDHEQNLIDIKSLHFSVHGEIDDDENLQAKGNPEIVFYNPEDNNFDFIMYLFKDGDLLTEKGFKFDLKPGEGMKYPLDSYDINKSKISVLTYQEGRFFIHRPYYVEK